MREDKELQSFGVLEQSVPQIPKTTTRNTLVLNVTMRCIVLTNC